MVSLWKEFIIHNSELELVSDAAKLLHPFLALGDSVFYCVLAVHMSLSHSGYRFFRKQCPEVRNDAIDTVIWLHSRDESPWLAVGCPRTIILNSLTLAYLHYARAPHVHAGSRLSAVSSQLFCCVGILGVHKKKGIILYINIYLYIE